MKYQTNQLARDPSLSISFRSDRVRMGREHSQMHLEAICCFWFSLSFACRVQSKTTALQRHSVATFLYSRRRLSHILALIESAFRF